MKNVVLILVLLSFGLTAMAQRVPLEQVQNYKNSTVTVCGKIYDGVFLDSANDSPTLLNMGAPYPNHLLTLLIWGIKLKDFPHKPEVFYINKEVCVTGLVIEYKGKPEIVLETPDQIKLAENTSFAIGQAPISTTPPAAPRSSTMTRPADTLRATPTNTTRSNTRPTDPVNVPAGAARQSTTSNVPPAVSPSTTVTPPPATRSTTTPPPTTSPTATPPVTRSTTAPPTTTPSTTTPPITRSTTAPPATAPPAATRPVTTTPPVTRSTTPPPAAPANRSGDTTLSKDDVKLTSAVPMRAGPGNNYELITQLKSGTVVTVLFTANGWSQVLIKNAKDPFSAIGYVRNSLLP